MSDFEFEAVGEVTVPNELGLHLRPVMTFVDVASKFCSSVTVANITKRGKRVNGKSAMEMVLLEATQGCVLRINAQGKDAETAVAALTALVEAGFKTHPTEPSE